MKKNDDFSYRSPEKRWCRTLDDLEELLDEAFGLILKIRFGTEDLITTGVPPSVCPVVAKIREAALNWRSFYFETMQALERAELVTELLNAGVDPQDSPAVDAWLARQSK